MESACPGCKKTQTAKNKAFNHPGGHVCQCKPSDQKIKIDAGIDQSAAAAESRASDEEGGAQAGQIRNDLKSKIIRSIKDLPPVPQVVIKIQQMIADVNSDAKQLAKIIESDQAIAAKVLQMANSSFYGMSGKISSIQHASLILGYQTLGEIVTMAGTAKLLDGKMPGYGYDAQDLWKHSLSVAFSSKLIAAHKNKDQIPQAHSAGLIHDVGKIILDPHVLEINDQIADYMSREEKTFLDAERHFFGFDHAEIAAEICRSWKIPETITLAIKCHHQPSLSGGDELAYILHMADYIAAMGGIGYDEDDALYELENGTMDVIGLTQQDVSNMMLEVIAAVDQF